MEIVLASKSPRRREILNLMGIENFKIHPTDGEEKIPPGTPPDETVMLLAAQKAREAAERFGRDDAIIAADTLVYLDGEPLGKPADKEDAKRMLRKLSGRGHKVYSGVCVIHSGREIAEAEMSDVFFRHMDEDEIEKYVDTGEPMDKAGAYGAQGRGAVFVERIEGDFFNVMGLPACRLYLMLKKLEVI